MQLDASAITHILNGKRKLQLPEAEQIARFLGLPVDDVLTHAGVNLRRTSRTVRLVGTVDDIGIIKTAKNLEIEAPLCAYSYVAVQFRTNSMLDGVVAFYDPSASYPPQLMTGKLCILLLDDGSQRAGILRAGLAGKFDIQFMSHLTEDTVISEAYPIAWIKP